MPRASGDQTGVMFSARLVVTRREFSPTDRVAATIVLYQGIGSPAQDTEIKIQLADGRGTVVDTQARVTAAKDFATQPAWRAVPITYDVPLALLKPGAYLLTFTARVGQTISRRDIEFTTR